LVGGFPELNIWNHCNHWNGWNFKLFAKLCH
jgi:hypothetical protein